ncbi:lipoprotein LipL41 [Leptospira andrefontaineae]|uniref:Lipoprotein LipL41 n=1 Tax=Leptospira andrefontaineae TaxID=2484976 RepID=A0A4R9H4I8_9LEPT|nr:lipoprotein LipL41 [Leptospira andrefontaineae]TGK39836.1 lipoprotein LipL41 [Leptospira andrefontaineae]
MRLTLVFLFCLLATFITCQSVTIEYPMYPPTKEGRDLKQFLNGVKTIAFVLEPMNSEIWNYESNRSFVLMVPGKIYENLSQDSFFKILDLKDRVDVIEEKDLTLEGIQKNRKKIEKILDADVVLYVSVKQPESQCYVETKMDYIALGMAVLRVAAGAKNSEDRARIVAAIANDPIMKPTGVRKVYIPLEANLIRTDSGEMMKTILSKPSIIYNGVGDVSCPSMLPSLSTALDESISEIQRRLSPKAESEDISIFTEDENPEVEALLLEGYEEITGENPNFQRAKSAWEKADLKAKGKSWAAKANLATYYFSEGDYQKAVQFYDEAIRLGSPEDDYLKELKELMTTHPIEEEAKEE